MQLHQTNGVLSRVLTLRHLKCIIANHVYYSNTFSVLFAVKLEIDTTADERNQTNSNSLDMRPKGGARNADGTDHMRVDTEEIREELKYTLLETNSGGHTLGPHTVATVAVLLIVAIARGAMMDV